MPLPRLACRPGAAPRQNRLLKALLGVLIGVGALLTLGAAYQRYGSLRDLRRFPPGGQFHDLGSHRLHYVCGGSGEPTVWLESGLPRTALDWALVQPALEKLTRTCSYDRGGYGYSEPGPGPRDARRLADEFFALADSVSPQGRLVLVGHSWGGLLVRRAAAQRPERVAALILVDPTPAELVGQMPPAARREWDDSLQAAHLLALVEPVGLPRVFSSQIAAAFGESRRLAPYPAPIRDALLASMLRSGYFPTTWAEVSVWEATMRQAATAESPLRPDLPLRTLVAGRDKEDWEKSLIAGTAQLTGRGQSILVPESNHEIHSHAPERVIGAVREIVESLRAPAAPAAPATH